MLYNFKYPLLYSNFDFFKFIYLKTFNSIATYHSKRKSIVTIGTFDGVHLGHKKILEKIIYNSELYDCESVVLTFFPHPRMVLEEDSDIKLLNTVDEKVKLFGNLGLDNLIIHPFNEEFSKLSAEEFVKSILVDKLNIKKIIIGYDHRFGKNRLANIDDLIIYGEKYGFEVEQITAQELNDIAISSTKIRNSILEGNIELANNYLGYNYFFSGTVVKGNQLGRTINYPTANINVEEKYKLIPKNGVYIVSSNFKNKIIYGMMNIGNRPTVDGKNTTIEVNFFNLNENLYHEYLTISILKKVRDEIKFNSTHELQNQLNKDKKNSLLYLSDFK